MKRFTFPILALLVFFLPALALACDPPSGQQASSTSTTATLSWDAAPNADSYDVSVGDANNNPFPFDVEVTVTGTNYTVSGLVAGQDYKFKVRTNCNGDHGDWSEEFFFVAGGGNGGGTGGGNCGIPAALNATVTNSATTLLWAAVAGVTAYMIEVEDASGNPVSFVQNATVTGTTFVPTGLTAGQAYKFKVRSVCGGNQSDWADWFFFTAGGNSGGTGGGNCGIPAALNATVASNTTTLSWADVAGVSAYLIEVEDASGNPVPYFFTDTINTTSFAPMGLNNQQAYKFKVRSLCGSNQSDWSAWFFFSAGQISGGNNGSNCNTPSGLNALPQNTGLLLQWTPVSGAVSYSIEVENSIGNNTAFVITTTVDTNIYVLTGLQPNLIYKYKVRANCSNGSSDWSGWLIFNTGGAISTGNGGGTNGCSIPVALTATPDNSAMLLSWSAVPGAISYLLEIEDADNNPTPFELTAASLASSYSITGLTPNQSYKFKVRAVCANGQSSWSKWKHFNSSSGISNPSGGGNGCNTVPVGLSVITAGGQATIGWSAVFNASSYSLEVEESDNTTPIFNFTGSTTNLSIVVAGLVINGNYKYKVRANCANATGLWSDWTNFVATPLAPERPDETSHSTEPAVTVLISPNPARFGQVEVQLNGLKNGDVQVQLLSLSGKVAVNHLFEVDNSNLQHTLQLPNNWAAGLYYLRIRSAEHTKTLPLLITTE
jgi:Fibronectin type III domain/Secretion system C-terminal sorting domain